MKASERVIAGLCLTRDTRNLWLLTGLTVFLFVVALPLVWWWKQQTDPLPIVWTKLVEGFWWEASFSPDGQNLIISTIHKGQLCVEFRRSRDGRLIRRVTIAVPKFNGYYHVSPDGTFAVLCLDRRGVLQVVRLWDGRFVRAFEGTRWRDAVISPKGRWLTAVNAQGILYRWRLPDGKLVLQYDLSRIPHLVEFTDDGQVMALRRREGLEVWDVAKFQPVLRLPESTYVKALSPDGNFLLTQSGTRVTLWQVPDGRRIADFKAEYDWYSFALSPDNVYLAIGRENGWVEVWRIRDKQLVARKTIVSLIGRIGGYTSIRIRRLVFSPDGQHLAAYLYIGSLSYLVVLKSSFRKQ